MSYIFCNVIFCCTPISSTCSFLVPQPTFCIIFCFSSYTALSYATLGNITQCFLTLLFVLESRYPHLCPFSSRKQVSPLSEGQHLYVTHMLSELHISSHRFCIHLSVLHFFAGYISYELLLLKEGY